MAHIVIIGNGISGITCARNVRKHAKDKITVISSESKYFYSRTALMYVFMGHMKFEHTQPYENNFWEKNNIDLVFEQVNEVNFSEKKLILNNHTNISYDKLVLATGAKSNKFGWPGQDLLGVQGLYSKQDLELLEENSKNCQHAVIVGGGLIGVEMAEMLASRGIKVTFLVRENRFWGNVLPEEEGNLVANHIINDHHIDMKMGVNLKEILSDENGRVRAIVVVETGEEIPCQIVGLTAGVSPNIDFLKNSELELDRGIMVDEYLQTNLPDVYAIGDCAQFKTPPIGRRPIEQVWYTGRMQGEALAKTLIGKLTKYEPGFWFNSAKFFDIEYQTYGTVLSDLQEGQSTFYWEHPKGQMCLKMVYESASKKWIGLNVFGIRLRHQILDKYLRDERTIDYVLAHLKDANFDPEFYRPMEQQIVDKYNRDTNSQVKVKTKSWKRILTAFNH